LSELIDRQSGFAEVNGTKFHYEIAGAGQPLVLMHAGVADSRMWDAQFPVFTQHYRVLRFDWRGFGKTARPDVDFSLHGDLHGLLAALDLDTVILIGVSMGGSAAINFTLEYPQRVRALITVGSGVNGYKFADEATTSLWPAIEAAYESRDFERLAELELQMWYDGPNRKPEQVDVQVRARGREMLLNSYQHGEQGQEHGPDTPSISRLGEITVPTLVIVGDEDVPDIAKIGDILADGIKGAKKVVMHDVAHVPNMEQPEEFNRIVLDFLRAV
jgi:pimeloyl-ACP methyl ester carboxylesterase